MKSILVVAIDEDGEHDIRCGFVEECLVGRLLDCDGKCESDPDAAPMVAALDAFAETECPEFCGKLDYACRVASTAGVPAIDHVIRFYTV